jgi:hypothetical protein
MAGTTNPKPTFITVKVNVVDTAKNPIHGLHVHGVLMTPDRKNPANSKTSGFKPRTFKDQSGCYELNVPTSPPGSTLCVTFPRKHPYQGTELILKQGYRVDVEIGDCDVHLSERVYEATTSIVSGFVEREIVGCDLNRPKYEVACGVTVKLFDTHGHSLLNSTTTDGAGEFFFPIPREVSPFLRFQTDINEGGQSWRLEESERQIHPRLDGRSWVLGDTVRYALCRARISGVVTNGKSGLKGVPITLIYLNNQNGNGSQNGREPLYTKTRDDGSFQFENVAPGSSVRLVFPPSHIDDDNKEWELGETPGSQSIQMINAGDLLQADQVVFGPALHTVLCNVTLPDGSPAANRVVRVLDERDNEVGVQMTDATGKALIDVVRSGRFKVIVYSDSSSAGAPFVQHVNVNSQVLVHAKVPDLLSSTTQATNAIASMVNDLADKAGSRLGAVGEAFIDTSAYPVLTEPVSFPYPTGGGGGGGSGGGGGAAARGAALGPMVEGAIRDVLGWRPKTSDPKAFVSALTQSFDRVEVEGHVECKWNERSYAAQVTTDMGAVTGAQASIFARAKVAIDQSLPLVQGLYPLSPQVLQEDIDSIRSLVSRELAALGAELGIVGGPRVQRVDELFRLLIQVEPGHLPARNPESVKGHIGMLGERLKLERFYINTIADEQNYTNFLIVIDYVYGLKQSWETYRPYFARSPGTEPFFGTQLVLLSRSLTAVGEAVDEVCFAMDSVFLGPAERQTIELQFRDRTIVLPRVPGSHGEPIPGSPSLMKYKFDNDAAPLFIAELLDWTAMLPSESAPMLDDSGKDGLIAVFSNVDRLRKLVHGALMQSNNGAQRPTQPLPAGYKTPRVQRSLGELADALDEASKLAGEISAREAVPRRDLQDLPFLDTLNDAIKDPALRNRLTDLLHELFPKLKGL